MANNTISAYYDKRGHMRSGINEDARFDGGFLDRDDRQSWLIYGSREPNLGPIMTHRCLTLSDMSEMYCAINELRRDIQKEIGELSGELKGDIKRVERLYEDIIKWNYIRLPLFIPRYKQQESSERKLQSKKKSKKKAVATEGIESIIDLSDFDIKQSQRERVHGRLLRKLYFSYPDKSTDKSRDWERVITSERFNRADDSDYRLRSYLQGTEKIPSIRTVSLFTDRFSFGSEFRGYEGIKIGSQDNNKYPFERTITVSNGVHNYEIKMFGGTAQEIDVEEALTIHFAGCVERSLRADIDFHSGSLAFDISEYIIKAANMDIFRNNDSFKAWVKALCFFEPEIKEGIAAELSK